MVESQSAESLDQRTDAKTPRPTGQSTGAFQEWSRPRGEIRSAPVFSDERMGLQEELDLVPVQMTSVRE